MSTLPAAPFTRFRAARPSDRLSAMKQFYVDGLACQLLGEFAGHEGFDGLILGAPSGAWQIEFLHEHARPAPPVPSQEHLHVFYLTNRAALAARVAHLQSLGYATATPNNPYWSRHGVTFVDPDGYHVVLAVPHGV